MILEATVFAGSEESFAGIITRVRGQVSARKSGSETIPALKVGDRITVGGIVETSHESAVQIVLTDDSVVNVLPDTTLFIKQYSYSKDTGRRTAIIKVTTGRVRFILYKLRSPESHFTVEAGYALVSVGLTDFFVNVSLAETEIVCIGQSLTVHNINTLIVGDVWLDSNQKTILKEKTPPSQPATVSPEQRRTYLKDAQM